MLRFVSSSLILRPFRLSCGVHRSSGYDSPRGQLGACFALFPLLDRLHGLHRTTGFDSPRGQLGAGFAFLRLTDRLHGGLLRTTGYDSPKGHSGAGFGATYDSGTHDSTFALGAPAVDCVFLCTSAWPCGPGGRGRQMLGSSCPQYATSGGVVQSLVPLRAAFSMLPTPLGFLRVASRFHSVLAGSY